VHGIPDTESYDLGCNRYLVKPLEAQISIDDVRDVQADWFARVRMPE